MLSLSAEFFSLDLNIILKNIFIRSTSFSNRSNVNLINSYRFTNNCIPNKLIFIPFDSVSSFIIPFNK